MAQWIALMAMVALFASCENMSMKEGHKEKKHEEKTVTETTETKHEKAE